MLVPSMTATQQNRVLVGQRGCKDPQFGEHNWTREEHARGPREDDNDGDGEEASVPAAKKSHRPVHVHVVAIEKARQRIK